MPLPKEQACHLCFQHLGSWLCKLRWALHCLCLCHESVGCSILCGDPEQQSEGKTQTCYHAGGQFSFLEPAKLVTQSWSHDEFFSMVWATGWIIFLAPVKRSHAWAWSGNVLCRSDFPMTPTSSHLFARNPGSWSVEWSSASTAPFLRKVSRRATELWAQFYGDTVQVNAYHRQAARRMSRVGGGLAFVLVVTWWSWNITNHVDFWTYSLWYI